MKLENFVFFENQKNNLFLLDNKSIKETFSEFFNIFNNFKFKVKTEKKRINGKEQKNEIGIFVWSKKLKNKIIIIKCKVKSSEVVFFLKIYKKKVGKRNNFVLIKKKKFESSRALSNIRYNVYKILNEKI